MISGVHETASINYELRIKLVFFDKIGLSVFGHNNITNVNKTSKRTLVQTNANLYVYGVSVSYRFNPFEDKRLTNGI